MHRLRTLLIAILAALPLLPVCGYVLGAAPEVVFFMGATSFVVGI
jgi:hypothetical protein